MIKQITILVLIGIFVFGCSKSVENVGIVSTEQSPKNIIIMISDGGGYNHIDAASIYHYGKRGIEVYEKFPVKLAMSTYSVGGSYDPNKAWEGVEYIKQNPTDSAAAATAMATGFKTYNAAIGMDNEKQKLKNILEVAEEKGKSTGVITTVPISHATPAGFCAHNESRQNYAEIANEMLFQSGLEVIMGCGNPLYDNDGKFKTKDYSYDYVGGDDTWQKLLMGKVGNDCDGDGVIDVWTFIQSREGFLMLSRGQTPKRICGIAQAGETLQQARGGDANAAAFEVELIETQPTLAEMVCGGLNVLDNDVNGFVLMIEGGAVDWASHKNQSGRMIEEEIDFNKAVEAVIEWVASQSSWQDTLLIVTADHETGYLQLKNGKTGRKRKMPQMKWQSNSHTNSLVPFFAKGKNAEVFHQYISGKDTVRGYYIDNTAIAKAIFDMLK